MPLDLGSAKNFSLRVFWALGNFRVGNSPRREVTGVFFVKPPQREESNGQPAPQTAPVPSVPSGTSAPAQALRQNSARLLAESGQRLPPRMEGSAAELKSVGLGRRFRGEGPR